MAEAVHAVQERVADVLADAALLAKCPHCGGVIDGHRALATCVKCKLGVDRRWVVFGGMTNPRLGFEFEGQIGRAARRTMGVMGALLVFMHLFRLGSGSALNWSDYSMLAMGAAMLFNGSGWLKRLYGVGPNFIALGPAGVTIVRRGKARCDYAWERVTFVRLEPRSDMLILEIDSRTSPLWLPDFGVGVEADRKRLGDLLRACGRAGTS